MRLARLGASQSRTESAVADRALHIGIDGRELGKKPPGVGRYLLNLLRRWLDDPGQRHRFTIFAPCEPPPELKQLAGPIRWHVTSTDPGDHRPAGTWWEQTTLPAAANRADLDVFFAPAYTGPLRLSCPLVLTIHDLSYFAHPEWFSWREGLRRRWITRQAARRSAAIVTISAFSAREIVTHLHIDPARISVIPHGAPSPGPPPADVPLESVVLYVGSMFARRHVTDLMEAFAIVARSLPSARLVLVGDNQMPEFDPLVRAASLGIGDLVTWRTWLSDVDLDRAYWTSRAFAFLSEYEGFALTPLEALAHDLPAVLLDTAVAREVFGDAPIFVPVSVDRIAAAIGTLLTDEPRRATAIAAGRQVLMRYSWDRAAAAVLRVLEQAARP